MIEDTGFYKKFEISETKLSEDVNANHRANGRNDPYKANSLVLKVRTNAQVNDEFVRFYTEGKNEPVGRWIVKRDDVLDVNGDLMPAQVIQQKLAIEYNPTDIVPVNLPANIELYNGIAGPQPAFNAAGGVYQFEIIYENLPGGLDASWYEQPIKLEY